MEFISNNESVPECKRSLLSKKGLLPFLLETAQFTNLTFFNLINVIEGRVKGYYLSLSLYLSAYIYLFYQ